MEAQWIKLREYAAYLFLFVERLRQSSLHDNESAFNKFKIRPRILADVSNVDTSTAVFGQKVFAATTPRSVRIIIYLPTIAKRYHFPLGSLQLPCIVSHTQMVKRRPLEQQEK